jgi:TPR repeat protein
LKAAIARLGTLVAWIALMGLSAQAETRFEAAVIGNSAYPVARLPNATRDAALVAETLAQAGFNVRTYFDLSAADFPKVLDEVNAQFDGADFTIFYYAGHAFQRNGQNELLAIDVEQLTRSVIEEKTITLREVLERTAPSGLDSNQLRLIIIDACRNDPFSAIDSAIQPGILFEESGDGQTLISYATSAGQVAYDGPITGYGPYALAFSRALDGGKGIRVSDALRAVRRDVRITTDGRQIPWVVGSTESDPVLGRALIVDADLPVVPDEATDLGDLVWTFVRPDLTVETYEAFIRTFPQSPHVEIASQRVREIRAAREEGTREVLGDTPSVSRETLQEVEKANDLAEVQAAYEPETNIPAELFRIWPDALPQTEGGMASVVTQCDLLASDPADPQAVAPPTRDGLVNVREAGKACGFALAADPENPRLQFLFGRVLQLIGLHNQARFYYTKAATQNYSAALTNLGFMAIQGIGQDVDYFSAARYYRLAAGLGNLRARTNIGTMFVKGQGVPELPEEGVLWYRLAAGMGWPNAQNALGDSYRLGRGVPEDLRAAAALYMLAAENGQRDAMNNLGRLYLEGQGVEKDPALGKLWLERAIEAGDRFAPRHLALELIKTGTAPSADEVIRLFELSADRGEARAYLDLASFHLEGGLQDPQPEAAYINARLAQLREVDGADDLVGKISALLTPETVAKLEEQISQRRKLNGI